MRLRFCKAAAIVSLVGVLTVGYLGTVRSQPTQDYAARYERAERIAELGHWEFHLDEDRVVASEGARIIYGLEGTEWTIAEVQAIPLPEYRQMLDEALSALIEDGETYDVRFAIQRPDDGSLAYVRSLGEYDPDSRSVFGTIADITDYTMAMNRVEDQARRILIVSVLVVGLTIVAAGILLVFLRLRRRAEAEQRELNEELRQVVNDLHEREQDLAITLESIGDAVISTDTLGHITRINAVAEALTGVERAQALGKPLTEVFRIVGTETREPLLDPVSKVIAEGGIVGLANHTSLLAADGREYQIADSAAPIRDASGDFLGVILVFHDVTKEYSMQRRLAESEDRFRRLFENSFTAVLICSSHPSPSESPESPEDFRVVDLNSAFAAWFGIAKEDAEGHCIDILGPAVGAGWQERFRRVIRTGECMEFRHQTGDGRRHFDVLVYAMDQTELAVVYTDVTSQVEADARQREWDHLMDYVIRHAQSAIAVHDRELRYIYVSQRYLDDYRVQEQDIIGKHHYDVFPDLPQKWRDAHQRALAGVVQTGRDDIYVRDDGTVDYTNWVCRPWYQYDGTIGGIIVYTEVITHHRIVEETLRYQTTHDALTGLYTRRVVEDKLRELVDAGAFPISVVIVDVNGLKMVNDSLGYQSGDELLKEAAGVLRGMRRASDVLGRWGGDEFVLLLPETEGTAAATLCHQLRQPGSNDNGSPVHLSLSWGCAELTNPHDDFQDILRQAEDHLYRHKTMDSQSSRNVLLASLQRILREKSYETEQHARNLEALAVSIGNRLALAEQQIHELSLIAVLHDLGKVAIPEEILVKPGRLDDSEWETMRRHPEIGYRIASTSPDLTSVAEGILAHHERWDGNGYPQGLAGTDIPLSARIVALVDAYDAMTSDRPYREALDPAAAVTEIERCAGTQFDPSLVPVFMEVLTEKAEQTR